MSASVLVMARAPRPGECRKRLEPMLGPEGCARLQAILVERAAAWAQIVAPGRVSIAYAPGDGDAGADMQALAPADARVFAQVGEDFGERLAAAVHAATDGDDALLVVTVDVPALGEAHAAGALGDLAAGCDVSVGPATGGSFYLLGLREGRLPALPAPDSGRGAGQPLAALFAASADGSLRVGLLRSERDLRTPADARAARVDPLTPPDVRAALAT